jgi:hypothetical protein
MTTEHDHYWKTRIGKEQPLSIHPSRPLPEGWVPSPEKVEALRAEFGGLLDLNNSLRRFRNHFSEGQTSRNWDARFENWVLSDAERARERVEGTDDLGVPHGQRKAVRRNVRPGDPDYVDPAEIDAAARAVAQQRPQ